MAALLHIQSCWRVHIQAYWRAYLLNLLFAALLLTTHGLAFSQEMTSHDEPGSGEFRLLGSAGPVHAVLQSTEVNIQVNGMLARVVVEQTFHNPSSDWSEGEYVFPLPTNSAVDYMAMHIGERRIVGQIREREAARQLFEAAKQAGKKASLVAQQRPNLFTNRVANIAPGETIRVELHYLQSLRYDQGRFSLRVPTTLTPRYIPGEVLASVDQAWDGRSLQADGSGWARATTQVPDAPAITPPMHPSDQAASLSLEASIEAGFTLADIASLHHPAQIQQDGERQVLRLQPGAKLDRDVVLEWTPARGEAPVAAALHEHLNGEDYLLLMVLPPLAAEAQRLPREAIFIIDTSGSMAGVSIEQARAALLTALRQLRPDDHFNIVEFNSYTRPLWSGARQASPERMAEALAFVSGLRAQGGTEMRPALEFALRGRASPGFVRQVVFITDGSVGNEAELFELISRQRGDSRVFTVGIGSAPNSHFMQKAAEAGQGSFTYIGSQAQVESKMLDLFHKLSFPVMTDIRLDFGGKRSEHFPPRMPDLYAGEALVMAAKFSNGKPGSVLVEGERNGRHFQQKVMLPVGAGRQDISTLWARKKLHELYDLERSTVDGERDHVKHEITALALQHQLLSPYTSFLAVEEVPTRPADAPLHKQVIPNAMPAGNTMSLPAGGLVLPAGGLVLPAGGLGLPGRWLLSLICLFGLLALYWPRPVYAGRFR